MSDVDFNQQIINEFRANDGKVGGPFEGSNMLLLHTTGAKTGNRRLTPLVYITEGDDYLIIASNAGADQHPAWFHNLRSNAKTTVEVGTDSIEVAATTVEPADRDRLWKNVVAAMPGFADYEKATDRVIPLVRLQRVS